MLLGILAVSLACVPAPALQTVTLGTVGGSLVDIRVMVRAGSAHDPRGREGTAALTASLMILGGFGDPQDPVTKERLADLTRPWGGGAYPGAEVGKETTVFSFKVPREALADFESKVLAPMFRSPLFDAEELDRSRQEVLQALTSSLRLEEIEDLGLAALDNFIHEGTAYAHFDGGTEKGLKAITRDDLVSFHRAHYRPDAMILGVSSPEPEVLDRLEKALSFAPAGPPAPARPARSPPPVHGRKVLIVATPNAISTGIHLGFPIKVGRKDPDYWPLYVGNVWFGTHRDGFSHLYQAIREERGYNYGDYSYIEHFEGRPHHLFPPFNTPRLHPYFSVWIRPVAHAYAPHILKAAVWELGDFVRQGLSQADCDLAKNKAKVLYLSLGETAERLLESKVDDRFQGLEPGWLEGYLDSLDRVTCDQVNAAIRKHLGSDAFKAVLVTDDEEAPKIAEALASGKPAWGKSPAEYQLQAKDGEGGKVYQIPEARLETLRRDAVWAHHPLALSREDIRIVPAERMFETADLPR